VAYTLGKMRQRTALQIHERFFAGRMHDFEDEGARI
jgi:hypothetical protein